MRSIKKTKNGSFYLSNPVSFDSMKHKHIYGKLH